MDQLIRFRNCQISFSPKKQASVFHPDTDCLLFVDLPGKRITIPGHTDHITSAYGTFLQTVQA